jgi:cobalt-precorrin 5A hydrolase
VSDQLGIWPVRVEAERLGEVVAQRLGGELFRPWLEAQSQGPEPQGQESKGEISRESLSQKLRFQEQFGQRSQWVLVMATGIATRFVDGMLRDKHHDPAVVVLDEAGRHAIALVAGHEGGANALAYRVANAVGAIPVVTTATEAVKPLVVGVGCRKGVSEEQIERAVSFALGRSGAAAGSAHGLAGESGECGRNVGAADGGGDAVGAVDRGGSDSGSSDGAAEDKPSGARNGFAGIREIVTVDIKAEEPGLVAFCRRHGIPLRIITKRQIEARPWVSKPSEWVRQSVGLDGVCEPCALIASTRGRLVVPKTTLDGVAVAIVADEWEFGS